MPLGAFFGKAGEYFLFRAVSTVAVGGVDPVGTQLQCLAKDALVFQCLLVGFLALPRIAQLSLFLFAVYGTGPFDPGLLADFEKLLLEYPLAAFPEQFHIRGETDVAFITGGIPACGRQA